MDLKAHIRHVPDFPKPGILFYDISTLLAHPAAWKACVERMVKKGLSLLGFFGLVSEALWRTLRRPSRLRWTSFVSHMEQTGVDALPIVGLLAFLIGVVFAYQGADQLRRFGAEIYTVNLLGISILRELGVLITAILVAGRSGSAFAAQIGTMKVNEEIDAIRTLGLDPIEVLVLPRLFAVVITLPLLTFYANVMGLLGGAIMSYFALDISFVTFLRQLKWFLPGGSFWVGLVKAPFFAGVIATCGCYEGLRAARSAESVGQLTTTAVVEGIFLVIVVDAAFSIVFSVLGV
jgi:phospholipid/cholesterol/gamma-HCH transport system permease protein